MKIGVYFLLELLKQVFHFVKSLKKTGPVVTNIYFEHKLKSKTSFWTENNISHLKKMMAASAHSDYY